MTIQSSTRHGLALEGSITGYPVSNSRIHPVGCPTYATVYYSPALFFHLARLTHVTIMSILHNGWRPCRKK